MNEELINKREQTIRKELLNLVFGLPFFFMLCAFAFVVFVIHVSLRATAWMSFLVRR